MRGERRADWANHQHSMNAMGVKRRYQFQSLDSTREKEMEKQVGIAIFE